MLILPRVRALPNPQIAEFPKKRQCIICRGFGVHCHGFRTRSPSPDAGFSEPVEVCRMLCKCCKQTYSLLPILVLRRVRASLDLLLGDLHKPEYSLMKHFHRLGVARNTARSWKKLGEALLAMLPELIDEVATWGELSTHISRWQYPNSCRRLNPTLP